MYRWKGKFVKKKVYDAMLKRVENGKNSKKKQAEEIVAEEEESSCTEGVEGNRIINVKHMSEQMYCLCCKEPLLMQNIENDTPQGFSTIFYVRCHHCLLVNKVKSSEEYVNPSTHKKVSTLNSKAALGAIHTGIGHEHINKFFHTIDLPVMDSKTFKTHERIVGPIVEYVAKESCSEATAMERVLTLESIEELKKLLPVHLQEGFLLVNVDGSSSDNPLVRIFASYDMGWSQRGNGYTYDSLNGYCAIIGLKTGKVLDYTTRNRKCRICDNILKTGKHQEHDCRLNFYGSSKAMEADGAVQLITKSEVLKDANVEVGVFIGDNDSCSISAIHQATGQVILKQSDMNHSTKGVGNLLHEIHKSSTSDPDKELSNDTIKHIQRCFTYGVHQNKGDVTKIKTALKNIPYHLFGMHNNCDNWCTKDDKENRASVRLKNKVLFEILNKTFTELSDNAEKFVTAASSQANESLNHSMTSKAPKNVSYSTSQSADYRFAATVAQKNCGTDYLRRSMEVLKVCYTDNLKKYVNSSTKISLRRKERSSLPSFKKKRLDLKAKRSQLRNRKERAEGETYKSNMGLLGNSSFTSKNSTQLAINDVPQYETDNLLIVFFDLETGGLSLTHDILQISLKSGKYTFDSFITPTETISYAATKINGLSKVHKTLFLHGQEVHTLPRRAVFGKVLEYLQNLKKKCILVAHNCTFDSTRFVLAIQELSLLKDFEECVEGFSDSLKLFRQKFPKRHGGHKLTSLASELLSLPCHGAHDAKFDVELLEKLTVTFLDINDIIKTKKSIQDVLITIQSNKNVKNSLSTLAPLKGVISIGMQKKLASCNISYNILIDTFKNQGSEETAKLLRGESNGKATLIKSKKILKQILRHLEDNFTANEMSA